MTKFRKIKQTRLQSTVLQGDMKRVQSMTQKPDDGRHNMKIITKMYQDPV